MTVAVTALNRVLEKAAPAYVTDPGRAIYRIYRDTRFSADKAPYKTHIGALFTHNRLGKNGGAAFYFHFSTQELLVAGGLYHCEPDVLFAVRKYIADEHERLRSLLRNKTAAKLFGGMQGDQLSRPPKGWCADHPAVDLLKFKDFLLETKAPPEEALDPSALKWVGDRFRAMVPFVEFLNEPLLQRASRPKDPLTAEL